MNALTKIENTAVAAMTEGELLDVLQSSLYPGAKPDSIKMVLGYCKAAGLDPMQKPVHIVPMNVKKPGTRDQYEWRDTIMPGVGLYRTQAARSGQFAGVDEPEFGPERELRVGEYVMSHPEWCKVTVYRVLGDEKCAYTAKEFWIENYATASKDSIMPNAMWKKRPRGQIAKCAQAQALRLAFPEMTGSAPTAEEMEGKFGGDDEPTTATVKHMGAAEVVQQPAADAHPPFPAEDFEKGLPVWRKAAAKLPVAEVLARAEAANPDFAFTEQQKAAILSIKKDAPPAATFASVADAITKAKDADALATARDLIRQVAEDQQRKELEALADERETSLTVEG
jgi:phage recombination protein Bet